MAPTQSINVLDLVISNNLTLITGIYQEINGYLGDHNTLRIQMALYTGMKNEKYSPPTLYTTNLHLLDIHNASDAEWE